MYKVKVTTNKFDGFKDISEHDCKNAEEAYRYAVRAHENVTAQQQLPTWPRRNSTTVEVYSGLNLIADETLTPVRRPAAPGLVFAKPLAEATHNQMESLVLRDEYSSALYADTIGRKRA